VARVREPAGVPGRPDVRVGPAPRDGERARLHDRARRRAAAHPGTGAGQLHGVAGRGVVRGVRRPPAPGPATGAARGAVRPARARTAVGRVRGRRVVRPVPGRGRHVRETVLRRARQGRRRRHGRPDTQGDVRHAVERRYAGRGATSAEPARYTFS